MSDLLKRLSEAEQLTKSELLDREYMSDKLEIWLDNELIDDVEYDELQDELEL